MEIPMIYYLVVSAIMFFAGVYGFVTRRNRYLFPGQLEGFMFTLFAIGIAAAETAVAIAIIINIYRSIHNVQAKNLDDMKY